MARAERRPNTDFGRTTCGSYHPQRNPLDHTGTGRKFTSKITFAADNFHHGSQRRCLYCHGQRATPPHRPSKLSRSELALNPTPRTFPQKNNSSHKQARLPIPPAKQKQANHGAEVCKRNRRGPHAKKLPKPNHYQNLLAAPRLRIPSRNTTQLNQFTKQALQRQLRGNTLLDRYVQTLQRWDTLSPSSRGGGLLQYEIVRRRTHSTDQMGNPVPPQSSSTCTSERLPTFL